MRGTLRKRLTWFAKRWKYSSYVVGFTAILMLWAAVILTDRISTKDQYFTSVNNLTDDARLFEENMLRSIGEVDKTLFYLRRHIEKNIDLVDYKALVTSADILSEIIVQVAIIDAHGIMRVSSADPTAKPVDLSDRPHFKTHITGTDDHLYISSPMVGRVSKKWSIQFSRRLRGKNGEFAGVVVASLNPEHFTALYSSLHSGRSGGITLLGLDGIVRASGGSTAVALGEAIQDKHLLDVIQSRNSGTVANRVSGHPRITAFRKIVGHPLAVLVDIDEIKMMANVKWASSRNAIGALVLSVILVIFSDRGARYQHGMRLSDLRLNRSRRQAVKKSKLLALTLDSMNHGIMMVTNDLHVPIINNRIIELLDLPRDWNNVHIRFNNIIDYLAARGEFDAIELPEGMTPLQFLTQRGSDGTVRNYERVRPDGTVLEIRTTALADGGFVRTITDITDRRRAQEVITRLAEEDALTGLANRRTFQKFLNNVVSNCAETGETFAVFYLDLDRFKSINDTLGHPMGDQLLKVVADRLRYAVRKTDLVARLGGDEFAIIAKTIDADREMVVIANRVISALNEPYAFAGTRVDISTSVGIAQAPLDGTDADMLLKAADTALYAAKADGRNTYKIFEAGMMETLLLRLEMEADLRMAIASDDQIELHYQPLLELSTNTVVGFEALMRWRHPEKGNVPPGVFIPIAEESGLIVDLGAWAIVTACRTAMQWPKNIRVAVNVSTHQFRRSDLVRIVSSALVETGLRADRLELEITESILMEDGDNASATLDQLRGLGVRIAMDDFGTGYSSLSYLLKFPLNKIKIDRSFISDVCSGNGAAVIIRSVIDIARTLDMKVTAEGVETSEQMEKLRALGCDEIQGYLISKPSPPGDAPAIIARWQPLLSLTA